ncbi:FtsX-like permease family protein [Corynebacterium callunae]|uniref:ABC transporter permease n=1 Tax=Corynebacterium callunae TaxID=1721 RepID=UPI003981D58A
MLLTVLSVVLGTAFLCGSLLLTNSLERTFSSIVDAGVDGVDLGVIGQQNNPDGVPFSVISEISQYPEVRAVNIIGDGPGTPSGTTMTGQSALILTDSTGAPLQAGSSGTHPFAVYPPNEWVSPEPQIVEGHAPTADNEIIVNTSAAERGDLQVGDRVTVVTPTERIDATLSGTFDSRSDVAGWIGVGFSESRYIELFTNGTHASQITIAVKDGADPMAVRNRIGKTHRDLMPLLPDQIIEQTTGDTTKQLEFMTYILIAFAAIALIVGSFIIANTFAMIVAQRTSEFALLRSIGVSSFQIGFSVVMEAVFIGAAGGLIGIALGFTVVNTLVRFLNKWGDALSSISISYNPSSFILPLIFALVATILSAIPPAHRAGNLPPVQAFQSSDSRSTSLGMIKNIFGAITLTAGIALTIAGALVSAVNGDELGTEPRMALIGGGTLSVFASIAISGPGLILITGRTVGVLVMAPFRAVGKLAQRNTLRNPRRSATTALAVTLSVGLVACVGVIGATTRASVFGSLDSSIRASFVLDTIGGTMVPGQPAGGSRSLSMPATVAAKAESVPGVSEVGTLMTASLAADSWNNESTTVFDGDIAEFMDLAVRSGETFDDETPGAMISTTYADQSDLKVGDQISLTPYGSEDGILVPISGIYAETNLLGHLAVNYTAAERVLNNSESYHRSQVFIRSDGTVPDDNLREALTAAVSSFLIVQVKSKAEFRGSLGTQINQLLGIVYGLLALAVIIAVLGIVNTLILSLSERTREIGILRATGVQRRQIRQMVTLESVILSIHGAFLGLLMGTFTGWAIVSSLRAKGMAPVELPWTQITMMLCATVAVGAIAALIPANRASKISPLEAIR